jgi:hypothetical protein
MDLVNECSAHRDYMIFHELLECSNVSKEDQDEEDVGKSNECVLMVVVINGNSEDGRIRDSNVKLRRNSMEEDAHRKARDTGVCRGEESVTVGSH